MDKQNDIEKISENLNRERKMNSDFGDDDLGLDFFAHFAEIQKRMSKENEENEQKNTDNNKDTWHNHDKTFTFLWHNHDKTWKMRIYIIVNGWMKFSLKKNFWNDHWQNEIICYIVFQQLKLYI